MAALLVLPPLVVALTGRWGDTLLVAALALAVVLIVPLLGDAMQLAVAIVLVLAGGIVAVAVAVTRAAATASLERFRLLAGVGRRGRPRGGPPRRARLGRARPAGARRSATSRPSTCCAAARGAGSARAPARASTPRWPGRWRRRALARGRGPQQRGRDRQRPGAARGARRASCSPPPRAASEDAALLSGLRMTTALIVPLRSRGRVIGALNAAYGPSRRRHTESDLHFAEVLAGRVALALDNAGPDERADGRRGAVRAGRARPGGGRHAERRRGAAGLRQPGGRRAARRRRAGRARARPDRTSSWSATPSSTSTGARSRSRTCRASGCSPASPTRRRCSCATSCARPARSAGCCTAARPCATRAARSCGWST